VLNKILSQSVSQESPFRLFVINIAERATISEAQLLYLSAAQDAVTPKREPAMTNFFVHCTCGREHFERLPRLWWMRLLPKTRLYSCSACGKQQLASARSVNEALWALRARDRGVPALR
jgi:hypothetical protein